MKTQMRKTGRALANFIVIGLIGSTMVATITTAAHAQPVQYEISFVSLTSAPGGSARFKYDSLTDTVSDFTATVNNIVFDTIVAQNPDGVGTVGEFTGGVLSAISVRVESSSTFLFPGAPAVILLSNSTDAPNPTNRYFTNVTLTGGSYTITPTPAKSRIYWSEDGKLRRANIEIPAGQTASTRTDIQDLLVGQPVCCGRAMALDEAGGKMYWTNTDSFTFGIRRSGIEIPGGQSASTRTDVEFLVPGQMVGLALDLASAKMYWTQTFNGNVRRSNLDIPAGQTANNRTDLEDLVVGGSSNRRGIALDVAGRKMYFVDGSGGRIQRANLSGSSVEDLATGLGSFDPFAIALDAAGGKIYYTRGSFGGPTKIQRANLTGSGVEDVVILPVPPLGIALDLAGGKIYWGTAGGGGTDKIQRANLDGSNVEDLITGLNGVSGITLQTAPANQAPTANAGSDQAVRVGDTVVLDSSASFDDNTPTASLIFSWSFASKPAGSSAVIFGGTSTGGATQLPGFVVDVAGTYVVQLVVTDEGGLSSAPDEVLISSDNLAPTARAGDDRLVITGNLVTLDGSQSSDPENDQLTFGWNFSFPPGSAAVFTDTNTANPKFIPDLPGQYFAQLVVSDFIGPGVPDLVVITAINAENYAEVQIESGNEVITTLPPSSVTTDGNQTALTNFLSQATVAIQNGDLVTARQKLQQAIERTDGCVLRGAPDGSGPGRDWITDCAAQVEAYELLSDALAAITP